MFLDNVLMAPNPKRITTYTKMDDVTLSHVDYSESVYPHASVEYTGSQVFDGYKVLCFSVCPFRYDTNTRKVFLDTQIKIDISLASAPKSAASRNSKIFLGKESDIKKLIANPDDINELYGELLETRNDRSLPTDSIYRYLIVTRDSLKSHFQRLAEWKTKKGFRAKVLTIEDIYQRFTGRNKPLKIKNALKHYYNNHGLKYVLLGGSNIIVPAQRCHAKIMIDNSWTSGSAPSDLFYACFSSMDWDTNGNNKYAELDDNVSLSPHIVVTRLPVANSNEASNIVDRILSYEISPDTTGWKNEMLMCGVKCFINVGVHENGDSISDSEYKSDQIYSQYIENSFWNGSKYRFYDTATDNPDSADYDVTSANLQYELEKGYPFVHVDTHGSYISWSMENHPHTYLNTNATSLNSPRYTAIVTNACSTNDFLSSNQCLGASFIRGTNSGVIAYYGCSEVNIGYASSMIGPGEEYSGMFFNKLFEYYPRFGEAINYSKNSYSTHWNSNSDERWLQLYLNALCDPETPVYVSKPKPSDFLEIAPGNNMLTLYAHTDNNNFYFETCLMSRHDNGHSDYQFLNECRPYGTIFNINDTIEYHIYAMYPGYIPYKTIYGNNVKLQNEQLKDNTDVYAKGSLLIGSNVASSRPTGPVVLENGHSVIKCSNGVTINGEFEVAPGASLEIRTN